MGCGSSSRGQMVRPGYSQAPVQAVGTTGYRQPGGYPQPRPMAPQVQYQRPPYPQQYPPNQGYRQPIPTQKTTYVQQQPNTVVVQDRGRSNAGDMVLGMAVGATMANAMHGYHHYGYGGFGHGGYHDHDTNIHIHEHNEYNYEQNNYDGDTNVQEDNYADGGYDDAGYDDGGGFDGGDSGD